MISTHYGDYSTHTISLCKGILENINKGDSKKDKNNPIVYNEVFKIFKTIQWGWAVLILLEYIMNI